jgi:hypothetical protein
MKIQKLAENIFYLSGESWRNGRAVSGMGMRGGRNDRQIRPGMTNDCASL